MCFCFLPVPSQSRKTRQLELILSSSYPCIYLCVQRLHVHLENLVKQTISAPTAERPSHTGPDSERSVIIPTLKATIYWTLNKKQVWIS